MRSFSALLLICTAIISQSLSTQTRALAPVVDDSENFAILDDQQADIDQPVVNNQLQSSASTRKNNFIDDERPLAHDDGGMPAQQQPLASLDKIQGLQQDIQELRGQLEVQSHEIKVLKEQQLAYYKDLDARLRQAPTSATPSNNTANTHIPPNTPVFAPMPQGNNTSKSGQTTGPSSQATQSSAAITNVPATAAGNTADEQISYMAAYELIRNKKFDTATVAMQKFLNDYPQGAYVANAQYWLGELKMANKNYPEAIQHFEVVLNQYPKSSKAAASLLKIGYAYAESGQKAEAKQKLTQVIKQYPDTQTAQLANAKLKNLSL